MKLVKTILNRRVTALLPDDQVIVPAWARGKVVSTESVEQDRGAKAVQVKYAAGGPEPILYLPTYVVTVERMVPLDQLRPVETP